MDNNIRNTFDKIHAEAALKQKTAEFLHEKIQQKRNAKKASPFRLAAICASFALFFIIGGLSYNQYFTRSAYIDIDVNPSIELAVNSFNRVIEANPYNDDGAAILQDVDVRYMRYEDAIDKLIDAMAARGYLKQEGTISITVQADDGNRESALLGGLQKAVENTLQTHHTDAIPDVFAVSKEVKDHAHDNHVSPAKYLAISELQEVDPTATFDDCKAHTIDRINQMAKEHGGEHHDKDEAKEQNIPSAEDHDAKDAASTPMPVPSASSMPPKQHEEDGEHDEKRHE